MQIARVIDDFVTGTDYVVCAVPLGAAHSILAIGVTVARIIAVEEVRAVVAKATARVAFEVVVASILCDFLPMQTFRGVDTRVVRAAVGCVDAVLVQVAEQLFDYWNL